MRLSLRSGAFSTSRSSALTQPASADCRRTANKDCASVMMGLLAQTWSEATPLQEAKGLINMLLQPGLTWVSTSYFLRAFSIFAESVTKPKHFFTFQIVASVQKSGEVVAQQSSISTQP